MSDAIYREAFMVPINEVLEKAISLSSFQSTQVGEEYRRRVRAVQASIKLLVDGNVVIQDDVSPELTEARRTIQEQRVLLENYGRQITAINRSQSPQQVRAAEELSGLRSEVATLKKELGDPKSTRRQLDKVSARLTLARAVIQDLREVVVPLHQQVKRVRAVAEDILKEAEGLEAVDVSKLLRISRHLVNEADPNRTSENRDYEAKELDGMIASLPISQFTISRR